MIKRPLSPPRYSTPAYPIVRRKSKTNEYAFATTSGERDHDAHLGVFALDDAAKIADHLHSDIRRFSQTPRGCSLRYLQSPRATLSRRGFPRKPGWRNIGGHFARVSGMICRHWSLIPEIWPSSDCCIRGALLAQACRCRRAIAAIQNAGIAQ